MSAIPAEIFNDKAKVSEARLAGLVTKAQELLVLGKRIETGEALLKELKEQYRAMSEDTIPAMLDEAGVSGFAMTDGTKIAVEPVISASITGEIKPRVIAWLRKNKHDGIITRDIIVKFGKGEDAAARKLLATLRKSYDPIDKEDVNTATFKALVKELIGKGAQLPLKELGVYAGRKTTITRKSDDNG